MNTKKAAKRALLTSVMALVMCVVMLVGTTFAWFTDTASTGVNRIQAGNLKVDILDANGTSVAKGNTKRALNFISAGEGDAVKKGETILWEPNCTYLTEGFQIKNAGNLALKWKIAINKDEVTNGKVGSADTPSKSLLDVIDFSIVDAAGDAVDIDEFTGYIVPADDSGTNTGLSGVYKIKAHMDANAGNDYQNLTLNGITITVYATQDTVENDSFDNQYDKYATYSDAVVVAPDTAQQALDNAVDGTVIQLTEGNYGTLYFRQSEKSELLNEGPTKQCDGKRSIKNVTIIGATGAVVDNIEVLDGTYKKGDAGNTFYDGTLLSYIDISGVTIKGVTFSGSKTAMSISGGRTTVDGLTLDDCKMTAEGTEANEIRLLYIGSNASEGYRANIAVTNCNVAGAWQVMDVRNVQNLTVTNNQFTNIVGRDIMISDSDGKHTTGNVTITNNTSEGGTERFVRIADASGMTLTITGNTITNYEGSADDYIKVSKCPTTGVTINGNNATAADSSRTLEVTTEQ